MELGIQGKAALITGGSHGIGLAIALALAKEGCKISICGKTDKHLTEAYSQISQISKVVSSCVDVLKPDACAKVVKNTVDAFDKIDILINNVGGGGRWGSEIPEETEDEVWQEVYTKNALTAVRFTMACLPYMRINKWGRVVTISSIHGKEAGGRPWFAMAKSAEISLMKTMAQTYPYARQGITFNSVAPGAVFIEDTGWDKMKKTQLKQYEKFIDSLPMGRMGKPEEIADLVTFLCSDKASFINGACIVADGGESKTF